MEISVRTSANTRDRAIAGEQLELLICPATRQKLRWSGGGLASADGSHRYAVTDEGLPLFAMDGLTQHAKAQQEHFDRIAEAYMANLGYPHTQEYMAYLDRVLLDIVLEGSLGTAAEICCGHGEAFGLIANRVSQGIGVDISPAMLREARRMHPEPHLCFVQGDATRLPLADGAFDNVFMLGGIHHVSDRQGLFSEVARILKPGGAFYFREPVSDFLFWRGLRAVIYRISPSLDHETERPLRQRETVPFLQRAGMNCRVWKTHGFFGFCLFMNSDVLVFNRAFQYVPGIRTLVRWSTRLDDLTTSLPGLKRAGLQVVGRAVKTGA